MEEDILKYFTGNGIPGTETIKPQNVEVTSVSMPRMTFTDGFQFNNEYYIRHGLIQSQNKSQLEVYTNDSLDNNTPLYTFDLILSGNIFMITDMKQDEDGRFYAIGYTLINSGGSYTLGEDYLVLFNNFIQDGELVIRKYYSATTMGIVNGDLNYVAKKEGSADYFILDTNALVDNEAGLKIYEFRIDITSGNELKTYQIQYDSNSFMAQEHLSISEQRLYAVGSNIVFMGHYLDHENQTPPYNEEYHKFVLPYDAIEDTIYKTKIIKTTNTYYGSNIFMEDLVFKNVVSVLDNSVYKPYLLIVDLEGNTKTIEIPTGVTTASQPIKVSQNYIVYANGTNIMFYYFDYIDNSIAQEFYSGEFTGLFNGLAVLINYNLVSFIGSGGEGSTLVSYAKNIYSPGYSSIPYYNNNFLIPQYINLYGKTNDDTSVIFSRNVSNRFLAGNQLTSSFNIPANMLNEVAIKREKVIGQTNLDIEDNTKTYSKNRFENLYLNYMYNIFITDNTNENNLSNMIGATRLADSLWNRLDYQDSPCLKVRITYEDGQQEVLNLNITNVSGSSHTFNYEVSGNINKIEYISQDERTIYATYRCNLLGTNKIYQTITVEEV